MMQKLLEIEIRELIKNIGYNQITEESMKVYNKENYYFKNPPKPNMMRITGRYELPEQPIAPWGYGFDLNKEKLPPQLRKCVKRLESSKHYSLGQILDVTINYRTDKYFRNR
eukprot:UN31619